MKIVILKTRSLSQNETLIVDGESTQAVLDELLACALSAAKEHLESFCYQASTYYMNDLVRFLHRSVAVPEHLAIPFPHYGPDRVGQFMPPTVRTLHDWLAENPE